jgi:hypothetical protein
MNFVFPLLLTSILLNKVVHQISAGHLLAGYTKINKGRASKTYHDNIAARILIPISPKGVPQYSHHAENAESDWLYLWNDMVGVWSKSLCLFCCFSCEYPFLIN